MVLIMLGAGSAQAADLWCMPSEICRGDQCKPTRDEETSVRLRGFDGRAPVLRSGGEDVPMRLVNDGDVRQWQGAAAGGAVEILAWRPATGSYVHVRRIGEREWRATGRCEVQ